ncbi:hypothetical protein C7374_10932 [Falsochrobactrum ovis]|uniref:Uncharacterized protein n=1 Tax=Falsochrobactrum ovis TaxID=1293442 RepID=A0A364JUD9_9HYPH|nr:hypothetical protein C7374_10932 [Falsochrobactrum ovis]
MFTLAAPPINFYFQNWVYVYFLKNNPRVIVDFILDLVAFVVVGYYIEQSIAKHLLISDGVACSHVGIQEAKMTGIFQEGWALRNHHRPYRLGD